MKRKLLAGILGLSLCYSPIYSRAESQKEKDLYEIDKQEIAETRTEDIINEGIEDIEKRGLTSEGILGIITRLLSEITSKAKDRNEYLKMGYAEGLSHSLVKRYREDPLFYDWRIYDIIDKRTGEPNNFTWRGKFVASLCDILVPRSKTLCFFEGSSIEVKDKTTWEPSINKIKLKIRGEMDLEAKLGVKIELDSPNKYLNNIELRANGDGFKIGKEFRAFRDIFGPRTRVILDLDHNGGKELVGKATLKAPECNWGFKEKTEKDLVKERAWGKKWYERKAKEKAKKYRKK